ncbi:hypothetical protein FOCC_FOCC007496 [Frankliniella occidentalis]|uniref:Caldesmon-like isoform X2 n=1 Tax=Frankliniella occidentalis TaxID=133901 RepID=A0A9C6U776_FRAOC|nr:caldesmon-like isoform X2 [Frankliniella occidentalis]KAE8745780.1 hypothetical protein FOCC_FOCC007496 [Frankliniella occidentalis]
MTDGGGGSPGVPEGDGALNEVLDEAPSGLADIRMVRADPAPWGFRLMGGRDYSHPLTVTRVLGCSIAEHANLKVGDVVVCVNGAPVRGATHREAQEAVRAAGDSLTLSVIRGSIVMPPPLDVDGVPLIQPPLAHEPIPVPEGSEAPVDQQPAEDQGPGAEGGPEPEDGVVEDASEAAPADSEAQGDVQDAGAEEAGEDEDAEDEEEEEEDSDEEEDEDEEARRERLDKLDGIRSPRSRMSRSPGPDDILRMQEKALARMEKARARKDRPPTVFLLPPDRPIIRQSRQPRPRPPDPPFKKLVHERIRRRKWAEDHPGEEYPFADDDGRTPTPDSEMTTRATMTPTPTFSDGVDLDMTSELVDQDDLGATEDAASFGGRSGRSSALRDDGTVSQASMRRTPDDDLQEREEEKEEEEEPELAELRRREEEERLAEEARLAAEREAAERAERERLAAEARAERERREAVERKELEAKVAKAAKFKTDVPEFIHEMVVLGIVLVAAWWTQLRR